MPGHEEEDGLIQAEATPGQEALAHIDVSRSRIARRSRVREIIFGTQDGLLTSLGLVTAVGGATADRYTVLVAGIAGAVAGMIAMGAGAFISSRSQYEVLLAEVETERSELAHNPERELEELVQLFRAEGLPESDARLVSEKIAQRPAAMLSAMTQKELRLQLEAAQPLREGVYMAIAFALGASVPIFPWLIAATSRSYFALGLGASPALLFSVGFTALALFAMGAGKGVAARASALRSGLEMVLVGLLAAAVSYFVGSVFPHLAGVRASAGAG